MKHFLSVLFLFMGVIILSAGQGRAEVKWYSFEEAMALNKEHPRKIFIDVYTDWCGWCKKMDQSTFTNQVIANLLNTKFYAVKFNAESTKPITFAGKTFVNEGTRTRNPHQLAVALLQGKMSYPSAAYMNEEMQLLTGVPGYFEPKDLEPILDFFATDSYKSVSYQDYIKNFRGKVSQK